MDEKTRDEIYTDPTGYRETKTKKGTFYRYVYGKGEGQRFVNTNKRCKGCPQAKKCYVGRHSIVMACPIAIYLDLTKKGGTE